MTHFWTAIKLVAGNEKESFAFGMSVECKLVSASSLDIIIVMVNVSELKSLAKKLMMSLQTEAIVSKKALLHEDDQVHALFDYLLPYFCWLRDFPNTDFSACNPNK